MAHNCRLLPPFHSRHLVQFDCSVKAYSSAADRVVSCEGPKVARGAATAAWRETPVGSPTVSS